MSKQIHLEIITDSAEASDKQRLNASLREEIEQLDVEEILTPYRENVADNTKGASEFNWGEILLKLMDAGSILSNVITVIKDWVLRQKDCKIHIELDGDILEISGVNGKDQDRLVAAWLARHREKV